MIVADVSGVWGNELGKVSIIEASPIVDWSSAISDWRCGTLGCPSFCRTLVLLERIKSRGAALLANLFTLFS